MIIKNIFQNDPQDKNVLVLKNNVIKPTSAVVSNLSDFYIILCINIWHVSFLLFNLLHHRDTL